MTRTISILSDNRPADSGRFECEHGLSVLVQTPSARILMDTGASGLFAVNAGRMGIDLSDVDYVFLSHGHSDHVGGLNSFLYLNNKAKVIVSPEAVSGCFYSERGGLHSISCAWPVDTVIGGFHLADPDAGHPYESEEQLAAQAERLANRYPQVSFITGHCTGDKAFRILQTVMGARLQHFACGMQISLK